MTKRLLAFPWIVSVPLLLGAFICSVFFVGTDNVLIAPAVIALLTFCGIALYRKPSEGWAVPQSNLFAFAMAFWLWLAIGLFWTTTPYVSTLFTIIVCILPCIFAASIMAKRPDEWVSVHAYAMGLTVCGFAVWALIQFFFLYDKFGPRIHHPFLDPNSLGGLLNLAICPALGLFFALRGRLRVGLAGLAVTALYMALVVSQSRAGFALCIGAALVFLPFALWRNPQGFPWRRLCYTISAAVAVPWLLSGFRGAGTLDNLVGSSMAESFTERRSLEDRYYLWQSTWHMIKDHFFFGTGLASFYFYYPHYRNPLDRSDGFFAHMDPLQYWAETGVLTPILFYAVLICALLRTVHALRRLPRENFSLRMKIIAPFCGMLALCAHAHLNYHLYMPGLLLPLSILLSYWYVATEQAMGGSENRWFWNPAGRKQRLAAVAACLMIALLAGGWIARISTSTWIFGQIQQAATANNSERVQDGLRLASVISPRSYGRVAEYEARLRVSKLWGNAAKMDPREVRQVYEEASRYLDEAEKQNPAFTTIWDLRARLNYSVDGILIKDGQDVAIRELKRVLDANPLSVDARIMLSQIYKKRGDLKTAAFILESGAHWPRPKGKTDLSFLINLSQLKSQQGDKQAAALYMQEAQKRAKAYGIVIQQAPPSQ